MECADIMIAAGRRSWKPARKWRKPLNVIRTYLRLARPSSLSADVLLQRSNSFLAIKIHHDDTDSDFGADSDDNGASFSVAADDDSFKGLVKEKRDDCFRRLGGIPGIAAALVSDTERGIRGDDADVRRRREAFGGNTYHKLKPKSFFTHAWDALSDVVLIVLLICAFLSLGFGIKEHGLKEGCYDGASIFLAVFVVAAVSAVSNRSQAKQFNRLASESDNISVAVVRADRRQEISIADIVVGDVVILKMGDSVPADGVFLDGHGLQVNESNMTGEPHPIEIHAENPFLAAGVKVIDGYGRILVTAVGNDTFWGEMISSITKETTQPTALQERLEHLTSSLGKIGVAVGVLVFTVLAARHFTGCTKDDQDKPLFATIIVVAIPEGLTVAVTLTLAFSVKRMVKENALVRHLSACETMGSVTVICTDKTGALTLNQMKVTEFWVGTEQPSATSAIAEGVVSLLCRGAGINTTGSVYKPDNLSPPEISGSPTEKALLSWAVADLGMDADALRRSCKKVHGGAEAITTGKMPLTMDLFWVNLIMGPMGALALATDTPTKALMDRPPIGRTAPLISNAMWRNIAVQAAFQIAVVLAIQYQSPDILGTDEKANDTMIFNVFVLCQVFNEFNAREIEKKNVFAGVLKNRVFLAIIAVTLVLQVLMVEVLTRFAGTKMLGLGQWGVCLAVAAVSWPVGWAVKFIPVPDRTVREIFTRRYLAPLIIGKNITTNRKSS